MSLQKIGGINKIRILKSKKDFNDCLLKKGKKNDKKNRKFD